MHHRGVLVAMSGTERGPPRVRQEFTHTCTCLQNSETKKLAFLLAIPTNIAMIPKSLSLPTAQKDAK